MVYFEWDKKKNQANQKKHGIWFEEGSQVFNDTGALLFFDEDHSNGEERFILLGTSTSGRTLVVVHCVRREGSVVRIISARKATPKENERYEKGI